MRSVADMAQGCPTGNSIFKTCLWLYHTTLKLAYNHLDISYEDLLEIFKSIPYCTLYAKIILQL